nr:potassium channel SKOR-like isoform X1 [Ipomoea batatas]
MDGGRRRSSGEDYSEEEEEYRIEDLGEGSNKSSWKKFSFRNNINCIPSSRQRQTPHSCHGFLIHPDNRWYLLWTQFILIWAVYSSFFTPLEFGFFRGLPENLFLLDIAGQIAFLIDVVVRFFVAYRDAHSYRIVFNPNQIAIRYLKSRFLVDVLGCFPWDAIYKISRNCMSLTSGWSPFSKIALMGSSNRLQSECMKNFPSRRSNNGAGRNMAINSTLFAMGNWYMDPPLLPVLTPTAPLVKFLYCVISRFLTQFKLVNYLDYCELISKHFLEIVGKRSKPWEEDIGVRHNTKTFSKHESELAMRLNCAAHEGDLYRLRCLIGNAGADPAGVDYNGKSPLITSATNPLFEAMKGGHDHVTCLLVKAGASLDIEDAGSCLCNVVVAKRIYSFLRSFWIME